MDEHKLMQGVFSFIDLFGFTRVTFADTDIMLKSYSVLLVEILMGCVLLITLV